MICLFHSSTFEVCDHNVVITWFIRAAVATTDLSLATQLKTAVFIPFFLTRNAFIKTRNRCIFFASTSNETFQTHIAALPPCQARVKWARKRYTSQMSFGRTTRCCQTICQWNNLSCPVSRHCAHGARSHRIIINKRTRNYEHTSLLSVKSWNYQKRRLKLQTVHACMNALHFRTSLKCILKYRLSCNGLLKETWDKSLILSNHIGIEKNWNR